MGARVSEQLIQAMSQIKNDGVTAYQAAKNVGIEASTVYRSRLYKLHIEATGAAVEKLKGGVN